MIVEEISLELFFLGTENFFEGGWDGVEGCGWKLVDVLERFGCSG
jgi:hypothetical protein